MFGFHPHHRPDRAAWAGHCGGRSRHQFGAEDFEEHGMFGHRGARHGEGSMRFGGRQRLFAQGDLRLVVLALLQERPRHGYEVIKAIEELVGGDYSPSPGVIYPTLTLLQDDEEGAPDEVWARVHAKSHSRLMLEGRTL